MLVARSALRMSLKNRVVLWVLRDGQPWDEIALHRIAGEEIRALAHELTESADRLAAQREVASTRTARSRHQSDYSRRDLQQLRLREETNRAVAAQLLELAKDEAAVTALLADARDANLLELVSSRPLPYEPTALDEPDPVGEQERIAALRDELQAMLDRAEGRTPKPRYARKPGPEAQKPWWRAGWRR
jgi:hypothetical protein